MSTQTSPGGGPKISDRNRAILEELNAVDLRLYSFIERFLAKRIAACGVEP